MVEITPNEKKVLQAMKDLSATSETSLKSSEDITNKSNLAKGVASTALITLMGKRLVVRRPRQKAAGYYLTQEGQAALQT